MKCFHQNQTSQTEKRCRAERGNYQTFPCDGFFATLHCIRDLPLAADLETRNVTTSPNCLRTFYRNFKEAMELKRCPSYYSALFLAERKNMIRLHRCKCTALLCLCAFEEPLWPCSHPRSRVEFHLDEDLNDVITA